MLRQFVVSKEDYAPALYNWARYFNHVVLRRSVTYPDILGPIFAMIGSKNLEAVDVGANVGVFTRYLSRHFAKTHAIEPVPHLARRLRSIAPSKVEVYNCALGSEDGEILIRTPLDASGRRMDALTTAAAQNNFDLFGHSGTIETKVEQHRLGTLLEKAGKIGFIKIDVEGFENEVIKGALATLQRHRPLLMIEISKTHNPSYEQLLFELSNAHYFGMSITQRGVSDRVVADIAAQPSDIRHRTESGDEPQWDFFFVPRESTDRFAQWRID